MVRRRRGHRVDIAFLEHLAHVGVSLYLDLLLVGGGVDAGVEDGGIDIAECGETNALHARKGADVGLTAAIHPDHADADVVVGAEDSGIRPGQSKTESGSVFENFSPID